MNRLKNLRIEKGKLQSDIANYLNISISGYSLYELGKRDIPTEYLIKLADYFNTTIDYILGKSDISTPINIQKIKYDNNKVLDTNELSQRDNEKI